LPDLPRQCWQLRDRLFHIYEEIYWLAVDRIARWQRDLDNISHWFWQLTWKQKGDDGKYRSPIASVPPERVEQVKVLIAGNVELETILAYLRGSM
jgi:hypothetical protein